MRTLMYEESPSIPVVTYAPPRRVLLVEAGRTFRAGLSRALLNVPDLITIAEPGTAMSALEAHATRRPEIVVIDVHLPDQSGIELCRELLERDPLTRVLILSNFDWDVYLAASWSAGAAGFRPKEAPTEELIRAIRGVATGRIYTAPQLARIEVWDRVVGDRLQTLRLREWEVLRLIAAGQSNREISQKLSLSENTVEKHLTSLHQKLRVSSRTGLLAFVLRYHLDHTDALVPAEAVQRTGLPDVRVCSTAESRFDPRALHPHLKVKRVGSSASN